MLRYILFPDDKAGELACLTVHSDYRSTGCGDTLLRNIETRAKSQGSIRLFVLTTRASHWFVERGFLETEVGELPKAKQGLYNYRRRSKVFVKKIYVDKHELAIDLIQQSLTEGLFCRLAE